LRENTYFYNGKTYHLNPHGFAKEMPFVPSNQSAESVILTLSDTPETKKAYPFAFAFAVEYKLTDNGLCVTFRVTNHSENELPFSLGGHWGFALKEKIDSYGIVFDDPLKLYREVLDGAYISGEQEQLQVYGNRLPLSYHICDNDTYVLANAPPACTLFHGDEAVVRLEYPDSPHLLIWTLPDAHFVCLEPWNGMPDGNKSTDITQKPSIHLLPAGQSKSFVHRIIF
jgi:galactose mutarotase-like enzyme